jgi:hypothetical protein
MIPIYLLPVIYRKKPISDNYHFINIENPKKSGFSNILREFLVVTNDLLFFEKTLVLFDCAIQLAFMQVAAALLVNTQYDTHSRTCSNY